MKHHHQRSLVIFAALLAMAPPVAAFVVQVQSPSAVRHPSRLDYRDDYSGRSLWTRRNQKDILRGDDSRLLLHAYNNDNNGDDIRDDWKTLTKAAGNIARKVGGKVVDWVHQGGSKLKQVWDSGAEKAKTALVTPNDEASASIQSSSYNPLSSPIFEDREDEALFHSIFGEGLFVPSSAGADSVDRVVEQAASLLSQDSTVQSLLGPNLRYGRPFSQSSRTTSINGRMTSTTQANFEVWGSQGQGVASATSSNGDLLGLGLEVGGRLYSFNTSTSTTRSGAKTRQQQSSSSARRRTKTGDSVDAEILPGIRRPGATSKGGVMDAEIEDKRTM
jgi:hypothetical protein